MSQSTNKSNLITFLVNEWKQGQYRNKLGEKFIFVTDPDQCFKITQCGNEVVPDLLYYVPKEMMAIFSFMQHML